MQGKLIVIEGTDGSGKGTQTKLLYEKLKQNNEVEMIEFPRYGERSALLVEDYLTGKFGTAEEVTAKQSSVFYAVDRYVASFQIKKWLSEGKIVLCNRYVSASMGHQAGKIQDQEERKKFIEWLKDLEYNIFDLPRPSATALLNMPPAIGQKLVDKKGKREYVDGRDIHEDNILHLENAHKAFIEVAKDEQWIVIDCAPNNNLRTIENINEELISKLQSLI